jgi:MFS family permease
VPQGAVNYAMLVVGRFLGGIGIGTLSMVAPLYVSEISVCDPQRSAGGLAILTTCHPLAAAVDSRRAARPRGVLHRVRHLRRIL